MARKDWYYPNIPIEMGQALQKIIENNPEMGKYGVFNKTDLLSFVLTRFIKRYDEVGDFIEAKKTVTSMAENLANNVKDPKKHLAKQEPRVRINELMDLLEKHLDEKVATIKF